MKYTGLLSIFMSAALMVSCSPSVEVTRRIIHNNDGTDMLGNYWFGKRPLTVEDVNAAVDMVAGSQVTTYMMCTGSSAVYYPSKICTMLGDDKNGSLRDVYDEETYQYWRSFWNNEMALVNEGSDMIGASLKRARELGMETFITLRMNDLHFADTTSACKMAIDDFWLEHPEFWTGDSSIGYNSSGALDFKHPEVRAYKLALVREQLERYGELIDGVDLDFMRFFVYFRADEARECAPLMTEFVADIRKIVDSTAAVLGHPLLLSARVGPTMEFNMEKGIDVAEWVRMGLLDFLSIGTHWRGDPAMPVGQFRKDLENELGVRKLPLPLYASIDDGGFRSTRPGGQREFWTHGSMRGMASSIFEQGADGLYLFNYYFGEYMGVNGGHLTVNPGDLICRTMDPAMLKELGSPETLRGRNKVYALSDYNVQYGITPNSPFPIKLSPEGNKSGTAELIISDDPVTDKPEMSLAFVRKSAGECSVSCNGTLLQKAADDSLPHDYGRDLYLGTNEEVEAFEVPVSCLRKGCNTFTFSASDEPVKILRLELAVGYGPVGTHGYF